MKNLYDDFCNRMYAVGNQIKLEKVSQTQRKGLKKVVDKIVYYKSAFQNGQSWAALPDSLVRWTALTPLAVANVNEVLKFFDFPFVLPLSWSSLIAVGLIGGLMIFGILSWTKVGLIRRGSELGAMQNSSQYLVYYEQQEIKEAIDLLREEIRELKK